MANIVIVDDDRTVVQVLKAFIYKCGAGQHTVTTFDNVMDACDYIREHHTDLVFQDVHVQSQLDGLISAKMSQYTGSRVVVATSDADLNTITRVASGGYDKLILKPITQLEVELALELLTENNS